jgi:hypothetical protein
MRPGRNKYPKVKVACTACVWKGIRSTFMQSNRCPRCRGVVTAAEKIATGVRGTPTLPLEGKAQDTLAEIFEPTIPISVEYFLNERIGAAIKQLDQEIVADFGAAMRADFEGSPSRTYDGILRMEESKHDVEAGGAAGEDRRTVEAVSKGDDGVESGAVGVGEKKGVDG